jgi:hypothetical protein
LPTARPGSKDHVALTEQIRGDHGEQCEAEVESEELFEAPAVIERDQHDPGRQDDECADGRQRRKKRDERCEKEKGANDRGFTLERGLDHCRDGLSERLAKRQRDRLKGQVDSTSSWREKAILTWA